MEDPADEALAFQRREGMRRSVAAGALGISVAIGLVALCWYAQAKTSLGGTGHATTWLAVLLSVVPGLVIGVVDRTRPRTTAAIAAALFSLGIVIALVVRGAMSPDGADVTPVSILGITFPLLMLGGLAVLLAVAGASLGSQLWREQLWPAGGPTGPAGNGANAADRAVCATRGGGA